MVLLVLLGRHRKDVGGVELVEEDIEMDQVQARNIDRMSLAFKGAFPIRCKQKVVPGKEPNRVHGIEPGIRFLLLEVLLLPPLLRTMSQAEGLLDWVEDVIQIIKEIQKLSQLSAAVSAT